MNCNDCKSILEDTVCYNCGLVNDNTIISTFKFVEQTDVKICRNTNTKLSKMLNWSLYTDVEKRDYRLKVYITNLLTKLHYETFIDQVYEFVLKIMNAIKDNHDGPKRSRVKDGIIILSLYYISKNTLYTNIINYREIAKTLDLNIKYISKADKLITELTVNKKLNLVNFNLNEKEHALSYITNAIEKYKLIIPSKTITKTGELINYCEESDILLDCTPFSLAISCFYYILLKYKNDIDINTFSNIFNLSNITILKNYKKLDNVIPKSQFDLENHSLLNASEATI